MYPYEITAYLLRILSPFRPVLVLVAVWLIVSALIALGR